MSATHDGGSTRVKQPQGAGGNPSTDDADTTAALCNTTQSTIKPEREPINMSIATGISPGMIRQHPQLDGVQLEIIGHLYGPALGIAGPGSGRHW